jgi:hypothetical protein
MIAGEHQYLDAIKSRWTARLPLCEPDGEVLQATKTAWRLGKHSISTHGRCGRGSISGREIKTAGTQCIEGWKASHGGQEMLRVCENLLFLTACPPISITSVCEAFMVRRSMARTSDRPGELLRVLEQIIETVLLTALAMSGTQP